VAHSWIAWILGSCFERLGENQAALDSYDRGLSADPTDDGLSIAKHRLLHGESPDATPDAHAETNVGSRPIDSYQSLAHDHLTNRLLTMPLHA
jgi:predicted TPR repeat methyltransferase